MSTIGKIYGGNIAVDFANDTVDIVEHDASAKGLKLGGTLLTATAAEVNARCDDSAMTETVTGAGAISVTVPHTNLVTTAADALTLAAPTKPGMIKTIRMLTDGGDGTLASTNIVGQSSGSTSITFNDAGDYLVLVSISGLAKWAVLKEGGVTAA